MWLSLSRSLCSNCAEVQIAVRNVDSRGFLRLGWDMIHGPETNNTPSFAVLASDVCSICLILYSILDVWKETKIERSFSSSFLLGYGRFFFWATLSGFARTM